MLRLLLAVFLCSSAQAAVIAEYRFLSGAETADSGPNGYTLVSVGTPLFSTTTGVCGSFVGAVGPTTVLNYVSAPAGVTNAINGLTTYTFSGFAYQTSSIGAFEAIFGAATGGAGSFVLYIENGANVRWYDQTTDGVICSSCVSNNTCYDFSVSANGSNTFVTWNGSTTTRNLFTIPNRGVSIAVRAGNTDGGFIHGYVSDFKIQDCYTCTTPVPTPGILSPYMAPKQFRFPFVSPVLVLP